MSSPFARRPALTKTYGSRRTSNGPAHSTTAPRRSTGPSILLDSSDEQTSDDDQPEDKSRNSAEGKAAQQDGQQKRQQQREKREVERRSPSPAPAAAKATGNKAYGRAGASQKPVQAAQSRPTAGRRTRSSILPAQEEDGQEKEASTVWDETTMLQAKPARATHRTSARLPGNGKAGPAAPPAFSPSKPSSSAARPRPANIDTTSPAPSKRPPEPLSSPLTELDSDSDVEPSSPPPKRKRPRLSAPGAPAVSGAGKDKGKQKQVEQEDHDEVPPPFDFVPLEERIAKASPPKPRGPVVPPAASLSHTASALAPAKAEVPLVKPVARRPSPPQPAASLPETTAVFAAAPSAPVANPARPAPRPPPSPAKDLSALFSRFSSTAPSAPSSASTSIHAPQQPHRVGLKRSASSADAGAGGVVGRMKAGRRPTADERVAEEDEDRLSAGRQSLFPSPARSSVALDRSRSHPVIPSSPLNSAAPSPRAGSPFRSPSRPPLGGAASFGGFSAFDRLERGGSPSPSRPAVNRAPSSALFPSYGYAAPAVGSAYRPIAFSGPPAGLLGTGAGAGPGGPTRTYAAGRTLKRDVDEEKLLTAPGGARAGLASALSSSPHPSSSALLGLPPSLRRPLLPAPGPPRETYAALRARWGIDAEETLDADEEEGSQERGARVEGGGTLRKRGEGKRWGDEVGFLLEGLQRGGEEGDEGAARSSAIELLTKLRDQDWLRRLKASGQAESVYTAFRRGGAGEGRDRVLDTALLILLALLLRDQRLSEPLFRLSPSDISRAPSSGLHSPAPSSRPSSPALSRHAAYSQPQLVPLSDSQTSFPSFSSSPRKRQVEERDERCDLTEVLKGVFEREWVRQEIGAKKVDGDAGSRKGKKKERGEGRHLQALRDVLDSSDLFTSSPSLPITPLALALHLTRSLSSYTPRAIFQPQQLLCLSGMFELVVHHGVVAEAEKIGGRLEKYEKGLDLLPPSSSTTAAATLASAAVPSLSLILLALQILELVSASTPFALPSISTPTLLPALAAALDDLTLFSFLLSLDAPAGAGEDALKTLVVTLGALYGLTTEPEWAAALVDPPAPSSAARKGKPNGAGQQKRARGEIVLTLVRAVVAARRRAKERADFVSAKPAGQAKGPSGDGDEEMVLGAADEEGERGAIEDEDVRQLWDVLSLALGTLANLVDLAGQEEGVKDLLRELELNPVCRARRKCARACTCPSRRKPLLEVLADIAARDAMEDAPNTVYQTSTLGFLRLTLGLSLLDNPRNESLVLSALLPSSPSPSAHPGALNAVLDALTDLAKIQEQQREARRLLLDGSLGVDENGDEYVAETQLAAEPDELEIGRQAVVDEGEDAVQKIRETVGRLRRKVEA
ncbi:hypothetical protein JCM10213_009150 [Rhodosporidiobolus nylandii]